MTSNVQNKIGIFQVSVLATVVNDEKKLLMVRRSPKLAHAAGRWECVSGRIDSGELPAEALKREFSEELGDSFKAAIIEPYYTFRLVRDDGHEVIGISFYCRYQGGEIKLNEEHTDLSGYQLMKPLI
jgi:8-oxo-dGTP pyrophosphatase MutT (NUDIX family)